jgi:hypothetical protein
MHDPEGRRDSGGDATNSLRSRLSHVDPSEGCLIDKTKEAPRQEQLDSLLEDPASLRPHPTRINGMMDVT